MDKKKNKVYCLMGDGELDEGQIWEAAMTAGHYKLDNLCGIVDKNGLQIDGATCDVKNLEPLSDKWRAFGWNVIEVDGHNVSDILTALGRFKHTHFAPTVIIAHTVKGKGVSFMENNAGWHGKAPITYGNDDFALIALIAGFRRWRDERYLNHIKKRTRIHLDWMADDGSYPNYGSTFVCGIEHMEYLKLAEEFGFSDHVADVKASLELTAAFGLTLQERNLNDPMYYGGLYGQTSYGVGRERIHHRSTGYSMEFYLKRLPGVWPASFSSYGWEP